MERILEWEINVVKLKYPLKHYCKQSAIDIKKSAFNKVSTFVKVKWIGKEGKMSVSLYHITLLICVSWRIRKFHFFFIPLLVRLLYINLCCFFLSRSALYFQMKNIFLSSGFPSLLMYDWVPVVQSTTHGLMQLIKGAHQPKS